MPDDYVHCLFIGSIIGADYESRHCWVNQLLDSPAGFLGGRHRILLHDLETAKKLGGCCWWAGLTAALHIDVDNLSPKIKSHLENVVRPFKNIKLTDLPEPVRKAANEATKKTVLEPKVEKSISTLLRKEFLKVHKKLGISIHLDSETSRESFIYIEPDTLLKATLDYVNQFPLKGFFVNDKPYYELAPSEPRIIPHPHLEDESVAPIHGGDCLDQGLLKFIFSND